MQGRQFIPSEPLHKRVQISRPFLLHQGPLRGGFLDEVR
jgi:hypothetical protein